MVMTYYRIHEVIFTELCTKSGQEPLKWDFVFWRESETLSDLAQLDADFQDWYNQERIHSSIGYSTPWQKLSADARLSSPVG